MSYIGHRCTACGHPTLWSMNETRGTCPGNCGCRQCTPGAAEAFPTFGIDSQPILTVLTPGEKLGGALKTCGCPKCKTLHKKLAAA